MSRPPRHKPDTYYARNREKLLAKQNAYYRDVCSSTSVTPWRLMLQAAKQRAAKKGIEFDLTSEWAEARWTGKCEVTGIDFKPPMQGAGVGFWSASLDRKDNSRGYTKDNCRFVLGAVNSFKLNASDDDMLAVAKAILTAAPKLAA